MQAFEVLSAVPGVCVCFLKCPKQGSTFVP